MNYLLLKEGFARFWPWSCKLDSSFHLSLTYDCEGGLDGEN